jgi:hypothetical protein
METIIVLLINIALLISIIYLLCLIKHKYEKTKYILDSLYECVNEQSNKTIEIIKELCEYIAEENKRIDKINDNVIIIYKAFTELINLCKEKYQSTIRKSNFGKKAKFSSKSNLNLKQDISMFEKNNVNNKPKTANKKENKQ